jgi:hypothetical protein
LSALSMGEAHSIGARPRLSNGYLDGLLKAC